MSKEIKNKIYLDALPRYESGKNKGSIDWRNSVGFTVRFVYNSKEGCVSIVGYNCENNTISAKYEDRIKTDIKTHRFKACQIGDLLKVITRDFKVEIGDKIEDQKRNLLITNKKREIDKNNIERKWYECTCNACGFSNWWSEESNLIKGSGCSCCAGLTAVLGINTIWDTDRWMCDLGVSEEDAKGHTRSSNKKINVICPDCGTNRQVVAHSVYKNKTIFCSCGDKGRYPAKFINNILQQLNITYETEYSPEYLKLNGSQKRSDFFLNDYKLIIEADGEIGHEGGRVHGKSKKSIEELISIDNWKDDQHLLHGIKTIRINCFKSEMEYIRENILNSELINYFDFSKIDWNECEKFALKNIVKEVCEYWNQKEEWETTKDLEKYFKLNRCTIIRYLKRGTLLNWCNYSPSSELKLRSQRVGKSKGKPVEMFKNGISIGTFLSASELERQSLELFGILLKTSSITSVCRKEMKQLCGYTFEYLCSE